MGGKGGNARPEGDSRVSCRIRPLAYVTLDFFFMQYDCSLGKIAKQPGARRRAAKELPGHSGGDPHLRSNCAGKPLCCKQ
jgi:hypothetical protein